MEDLGRYFAHDDSITFRAMKKNIGLSDDWRDYFYSTGEICGFFDPVAKRSYRFTESAQAAQAGALPVFVRRRNLGPGSYLEARSNYIDMRLNDLYVDFKSRYRKGLDELVHLARDGIITYRGKGSPTSRIRQEAIRQRLRRNWIVAKYEHNLMILDEELGKELLQRLHWFNQDPSRALGETVYLKGFGQQDSLLVKVYDVAKLKDYDHAAVKIEITLRKDWLKRNGFRTVNQFTKQHVVQERIAHVLIREWKQVFRQAGLTKEVSHMVGTTQKDVFHELVDPRHTLEHILVRMNRLEQMSIEQEARQFRLEERQKEIIEFVGLQSA